MALALFGDDAVAGSVSNRTVSTLQPMKVPTVNSVMRVCACSCNESVHLKRVEWHKKHEPATHTHNTMW